MKDFLEKLFSSDFMPHGYCYLWRLWDQRTPCAAVRKRGRSKEESVASRNGTHEMLIAIRDSGAGIHPEHLDQLVHPWAGGGTNIPIHTPGPALTAGGLKA